MHVTRNLSPDPCFSRQRPGAKTNTSLLHLNRVSQGLSQGTNEKGEKALFRRVFDMSLPFPAFLLCFVLMCLVVMDCQSSARCRPAGVATGIAGQMGQHEDPEAMNEKLRLNLLHSLVSDVWVRLAPSRLHGVGVVAIRDIPKVKKTQALHDQKCLPDSGNRCVWHLSTAAVKLERWHY